MHIFKVKSLFTLTSVLLTSLLFFQTSLALKSTSNFNEEYTSKLQEQALLDEAREFDKKKIKDNSIFTDKTVNQYLQSVMNKVYPEFKDKIRVRILNDPNLNALALYNGSIYFNLGLLARLDNEAQLATILAHEGAHFIHKHILHHRRKLKLESEIQVQKGAGDRAVDIAAKYLSGFSRDLERQADKYAFFRMKKAGYDIRQSPYAFKKMLAEAKANNSKQSGSFSSHPNLIERIASYNALILKHKSISGHIGKEAYLKNTQSMRIADLELNLSYARYGSLILILENKEQFVKYPAYAPYYLGEAYRQRNQQGDQTKSYLAYLDTINKVPNFAPSYRAIGIYYMKKKRYQDAKKSFIKFLALAPNHKDAAYVLQYLANIRNK